MSAANGFVTVRPDTVYTETTVLISAGNVLAQRFTAPGTGTLTISEIGLWGMDSGDVFRMAIFEDDAANGCPAGMVANSDIELTMSSSYAGVIQYGTYGTPPTVTGGAVYWIGFLGSVAVTLHRADTGGTAVSKTGQTYPTWLADDGWHTATDITRDYSFYAVYQAAASGAKPIYAYAQQ